MKSRDMPISLHGYPTVSIRTASLWNDLSIYIYLHNLKQWIYVYAWDWGHQITARYDVCLYTKSHQILKPWNLGSNFLIAL